VLPLLTETERRTLVKYVERLRERLGPLPLGLRVFGSVARGEGWPQGITLAGARLGDAQESEPPL
jgi:hypothetical protein